MLHKAIRPKRTEASETSHLWYSNTKEKEIEIVMNLHGYM